MLLFFSNSTNSILILKLIESSDNIDEFLNVKCFKILLNLNSTHKNFVDSSANYFSRIILKLVKDEFSLLEITENIIRRSLYFKYDKEFSYEK